MAIINRASTPALFLGYNAKYGVFYQSEKVDGKYIRHPISGGVDNITLMRIEVKDDEYEGKPLKKLALFGIMDKGTPEETRVFFEANLASFATTGLAMGLAKMDPAKPFGIIPKTKKAGYTYKMADGSMSKPLESDLHQLLVLQDEKYVIGDRLPKPEEIKDKTGKVVASDKSDRDAVVLAAIAGIQIAHKAPDSGSEPEADHFGFDDDSIPF